MILDPSFCMFIEPKRHAKIQKIVLSQYRENGFTDRWTDERSELKLCVEFVSVF